MYTIRVWDLPTRLFHWALVACVVGLVITGNVGGNAMAWHGRLGYAVLTLLLFRLVWGVVGGHWSRFAHFVHGPAAVLAYLGGRGRPEHRVGHNPLGALSVLALLAVLLMQVASGLMADDEIAFSGPLAALVSGDWVAEATRYHKNVGKFILIGLIALHLLAIAYYRLARRQALVGPMLHGDKQLPHPAPSSADNRHTRARALAVLALCAAAVYGLVALAGRLAHLGSVG